MKRLLLVLVITLSFVVCATAQTNDSVTLHLKSGYTLSGTIINDSSNLFTIRTAEGDIFEYRISEIQSVDGKDYDWEIDERGNNLNSHNLRRGFRSYVDIYGSGDVASVKIFNGYGYTADNHWSLTYTAGYYFGPRLYVGAGTGLAIGGCYHVYRDRDPIGYGEQTEYVGTPLYIHIHSAILKNTKVSPLISLNVGGMFLFAVGGDSMYNLYVEPSLGAEIRFNKKHSLSLCLSMPIFTGDCDYLGLGLKVGFSF